ncbi:MAG: general stress protein CsbD [Bacteroidota bacterium]|nr:general stress protein CsbD [Bacteroidota bacterium]MDE2832969.1 general stress protein CsbD [Bacteroidota bacterium]MDE2958303.1 general stress protein CsbD [Bacteroidota bacterium]
MATKRMNESWQQVRSQIESIWSEATFSDQEMKKARGNMRRMVNLIHQKTGEPTSEIFQKISAII